MEFPGLRKASLLRVDHSLRKGGKNKRPTTTHDTSRPIVIDDSGAHGSAEGRRSLFHYMFVRKLQPNSASRLLKVN